MIFERRPWSFNGVHMNLKHWNPNIHFQRVKFDTSTFHLQIHGLPLSLLNEKNARLIGSKVRLVHEESISPRLMVWQRYLQLKVDIPIDDPIPTRFIQKYKNGEEY